MVAACVSNVIYLNIVEIKYFKILEINNSEMMKHKNMYIFKYS